MKNIFQTIFPYDIRNFFVSNETSEKATLCTGRRNHSVIVTFDQKPISLAFFYITDDVECKSCYKAIPEDCSKFTDRRSITNRKLFNFENENSKLLQEFDPGEVCRNLTRPFLVNQTMTYQTLHDTCHLMKGRLLIEEEMIYHSEHYIKEILQDKAFSNGSLQLFERSVFDKCIAKAPTWTFTLNKDNTTKGSSKSRSCFGFLSYGLCLLSAYDKVTLYGTFNQIEEFPRTFSLMYSYKTPLVSRRKLKWFNMKTKLSRIPHANSFNISVKKLGLWYALYDFDSPFGRNLWSNPNSNTLLSMVFCNMNEFSCDNGTCIPISKRCNEISDCEDKSDEALCQSFSRDDRYVFSNQPDTENFTVYYQIFVYNFADVSTSKDYQSFDAAVFLHWSDPRLTFYDIQGTERIKCDEFWFPTLDMKNHVFKPYKVDFNLYHSSCWFKLTKPMNGSEEKLKDAYMSKYTLYISMNYNTEYI